MAEFNANPNISQEGNFNTSKPFNDDNAHYDFTFKLKENIPALHLR